MNMKPPRELDLDSLRQTSRRRFLSASAAGLAAGWLWPYLQLGAGEANPVKSADNHRYKIAVCDSMILKRQKLGAFQQSALDEMGWRGWLVIERSRDARNSRDVKGNYGANARYLKSVFQKP